MTATKQPEVQKRKEVLRLWWEYLKRSNIYKEFSEYEWENEKKGIPFSKIKWPKKFQVKVRGKYELNPNLRSYRFEYMCVHYITFENWWKYRELKEREADSRLEIYDFKEDINSCIETFKEYNGREPTLQEFKDKFVEQKKVFNIVLYLKIDLLSPFRTEDLLKQIGKILKERRRNPYIRGLRSKVNLEPFSNAEIKENYLRREELWRYLRIYDYKKQDLSMRDVVEKEGKDSTNSDIRSMFYQDLKRAEKIIRNVELGIFPGDYQSQD